MAVTSLKRSTLNVFNRYNNFLAGNAAAVSDYELISTTVVGAGGATSITFSGLNTTYKHLQVRVVARSNYGDYWGRLSFRFNGDSGSNYSGHYLIANGSSISSSAAPNSTRVEAGQVSGNAQSSGVFSPTVVDILDAFSTTKNKTFRCLSGQNGIGGETFVSLVSGVWRNTAAVTSIDLSNVYGTAFLAGSRFSLYGLR